jgi:hypothetical protein
LDVFAQHSSLCIIAMSFAGRILVPAIDWTRPAGGLRKLYRHVDVLNANGIRALMMHQQPGFRCTWFENSTAVSSFDQAWPPGPSDVILVPEILSWQFFGLAPGTPKIIFNQNAYQTFAWRTEKYNTNPYLNSDFRGTIVVSEDSRDYLRYVYPNHPVFRVRYSIDPKHFHFSPQKKKQIAYMPRKKEKDAAQVLAILKYRGALEGFQIVQIEDKSEAETAQILRESAIFLSFSTQEGWGLPPMEAMACGCVTIGYDGRGGAEYLKEPYATRIENEDVIGFVAAVERAIGAINRSSEDQIKQARQASDFTLTTYTPRAEEQDILQVWGQILGMLNTRGHSITTTS